MIIALAHEPPFALAGLRLLPPTREIVAPDGARTVVEPRVMQVLIALARADGAIVTRDALIASCWEGRIVGEDAINRVISRLRHAGVECGGVFRIETVTRIGYRLVVGTPIAETPVAATIDPAADGRANPSRYAAPAVPLPSPSGPGWRGWRIAAIAVAIVVICGVAAWRLAGTTAVPTRIVPQLDVRAFTPLSPDVSPAVVAAAREEIVAAFGVTSLVDVTTAMPRGAPRPQAWTLTGAIGRTGRDLRFVVHLTHRTTGTIVWSTAIDRSATDIPRALKSLAAGIADIVATSLSSAASYHGSTLPDSALALMFQFNQDTTLPVGPYHHAEEELRRVVAQVPDFGEGWSKLALALAYTATASDDPAAIAAARAEAPAVIANALRYRPNDAETLMAAAKLVAPADFTGREAAFRVATAAPTSLIGAEHSGYSVFLVNVGRAGDAVREAKFTYDLAPLAALYAERYAHALAVAGKVRLAETILARSEYLWPDFDPAFALRTRIALWSDDPAAGIVAARSNPRLSETVRAAMLATFAALATTEAARRDAAAAMLATLSLDPATNNAFIVSALGALGDPASAVAAADRLIAAHNALAAEVLFDPTLADARRTPKFALLAKRVGLTEYWRRSGHSPDFCAGAAPPALCATLGSATSSRGGPMS